MRRSMMAVLALSYCAAWYGCATTSESAPNDEPDASERDSAMPPADSAPNDGARDTGAKDSGLDAPSLDAADADFLDEDAMANPIRSFSLGEGTGCAIIDTADKQNVLECWGLDSNGQTGTGRDGGYQFVAMPTEVALGDVKRVVTGPGFACAISGDAGDVRCWGSNSYYQLGNGISGRVNVPPAAVTVSGAIEVAAGKQHACARASEAGVLCWGNNGYGQLGVGDESWRRQPAPLPGFSGEGLALGDSHSCARSAAGDEVWCWGWNFYGQLGINTLPDGGPVPDGGRPANYAVPTRVPDLNGNVRKLVAALNDTCALMEDGTVKCWGQCSRGTCKEFFDPPQATPIQIVDDETQLPLQDVVTIAGGSSTSFTPELEFCALLGTGKVKCWGSNAHAQGGRPPNAQWSTKAVTVAGLSHVTEIAVGSVHACARVGQRRLKCWGDNSQGALGQGAIQPGDDIRSTPQNVNGL